MFCFKDKINQMQVSQTDREFLEGLETRSLTLILYSQTYNGKCRLINELLNELWSLDPTITNLLRTIRIKIEVNYQNSPLNKFSYHSFRIIQSMVQL